MVAQATNGEATIFWRYISSSIDRLVSLALEIEDDGFRWEPPAPQTNSIAALAFHTLGNAQENILETLCGQSLNQSRAGEFTVRDRSMPELRERWETLRPRLEQALGDLSDEQLVTLCNHPRRGQISGREVLIVVARHTAEHLGQAELTRDLWQACQSE